MIVPQHSIPQTGGVGGVHLVDALYRPWDVGPRDVLEMKGMGRYRIRPGLKTSPRAIVATMARRARTYDLLRPVPGEDGVASSWTFECRVTQPRHARRLVWASHDPGWPSWRLQEVGEGGAVFELVVFDGKVRQRRLDDLDASAATA